jgi:hypothetical protein
MLDGRPVSTRPMPVVALKATSLSSILVQNAQKLTLTCWLALAQRKPSRVLRPTIFPMAFVFLAQMSIVDGRLAYQYPWRHHVFLLLTSSMVNASRASQ